jgi:hypothetical protein
MWTLPTNESAELTQWALYASVVNSLLWEEHMHDDGGGGGVTLIVYFSSNWQGGE